MRRFGWGSRHNTSGNRPGGFDFSKVSTAVRRSVFTAFVIHLGVLPMNEFQRLLASLPTMRQQLGGEAVDKAFVSFLLLSKELVIEMDGVRCPGSVAAIINRFSSIHNELDQ